jgi:hypothetical protein
VRPFASIAALLMLACPLVAAPAPFPRSAYALERDPLYREAEAAIRAAHERMEQAQRESAELTPAEFIGLVRDARTLARQAAEKYTRLEAALSGVPSTQRNLFAMKTGRAWALGGDPRKALPHFAAVYECTGSGLLRAEALFEYLRCHWRLGQTAEIRKLAPQALQLRNALTEDDRERLDDVLRWAEKNR